MTDRARPRRRRSHSGATLAWCLASLGLGCNLLTGVDQLVIDGGAGTSTGSIGGQDLAGASGIGGDWDPSLGSGGAPAAGGADSGGTDAGGGAEGSGGVGTGGEGTGGEATTGGTGSGGTGSGGSGTGGEDPGSGGVGSGGDASGGVSSGGGNTGGDGGSSGCECSGGQVCDEGECSCPDGELDCDGICVDGICCPGEVLDGCARCGLLVCNETGTDAECTEQGVCEAGNTCGLLNIGQWDDGVTECNACALLEEAYCTSSCEPDCRAILSDDDDDDDDDQPGLGLGRK